MISITSRVSPFAVEVGLTVALGWGGGEGRLATSASALCSAPSVLFLVDLPSTTSVEDDGGTASQSGGRTTLCLLSSSEVDVYVSDTEDNYDESNLTPGVESAMPSPEEVEGKYDKADAESSASHDAASYDRCEVLL